MASSDIEKFAKYDGRIYAQPGKYAITKGSLSLTNNTFNAIGATTSQHTYNCIIPSQNVYVDRVLQWSSYVATQLLVTCPAGQAAGTPIVVFGQDIALAPFPLHQLVETSQATINDTSVILNTSEVLDILLRLTDYKVNRLTRTCPTMLDRFADYDDAYGAIGSPLASYLDATEAAEMPNGAWADLVFLDPTTGAVAVPGAAVTPAVGSPYVFNANGVPAFPTGGSVAGSYQLVVRWRSVEPLVLSPFIFADGAEYSQGLYGINQIQVVLNMKASINRLFRYSVQRGAFTAIACSYWTGAGYTSTPFVEPRIQVQTLTPSLDLPLPSKNVVPFMQFPRYLTNSSVSAAAGAAFEINTNTITLPSIPDFFILYCRPQAYASGNVGDYYFPIQSVNITLDNYSGLLNNHTQYQLYRMAVHNGLEMSWEQWSGSAKAGVQNGAGAPTAYGKNIQTVGGPLVLAPGRDIPLAAGIAPGVLGNFAFSVKAQVVNSTLAALSNAPVTFYIVTANSGFFESMAGSSRIVLNPCSEADVISAPDAGSSDHVERLVGHGFFSKLGSMLSKAVDIYHKSKPIVSGIKGLLPEDGAFGKVKGALGAVGYGMAGAGMAGAAMPAGAGKKGLSRRLM